MLFRVLYLDDAIIVLDKPSGLLSVPGLGAANADNLATRVQQQYPDARVVHRLDRDTSGVLLMARGLEQQRALSRQFEIRAVQKTYLAEVDGHVLGDAGEINLPLVKNFSRPPRHMVDFLHGRSALTRWQVIDRAQHTSRVMLCPWTGRSHQLRVHLAHIGHAVLGDNLYASCEARAMRNRLQLHAAELSIQHPQSAAMMHFNALCPF